MGYWSSWFALEKGTDGGVWATWFWITLVSVLRRRSVVDYQLANYICLCIVATTSDLPLLHPKQALVQTLFGSLVFIQEISTALLQKLRSAV